MISPQALGLSPDLFAAAFPFHFAFDRELVIRQIGRSLGKLAPALAPGTTVGAQFRFSFPAVELNFDDIQRKAAQLFVLEMNAQNVRLRGQMVYLPSEDMLIFLGSPWLIAPSDIKRLGLTLTDFALHDPVVDLLQVMQSQTLALDDTRRLAEKLANQRTELAEANAALTAEILERQAAAAAVREREEKFHALLESASEAIVITDDIGIIALVNARVESLFGYQRDEILGQSIEMLLPEAVRSKHARHRFEYMAHPHTRPMGGGLLLSGRRKDGRVVPLEISLSTVETKSGTLVMSFLSDVTERRRAEEELASQRDFALQIMSNMGQGLTVTDSDGRYEYVNHAFARMLGLPAEQLIGRYPSDFVVAEHAACSTPAEAELRAGGAQNTELQLRHASGEPRDVLFTCVPRLREGKYIGAITVVTDLAERKQIEQAMEWARDRAMEASRLKSDFLANMSHEIRTPLNSIISVAQMLSSSTLDEQQRELVNVIGESGQALLALVNDVLDFSKIEAGKLVLEMRPFPLRRCIESTLDVVSTAAAAKGLELAYVIEHDVPELIVGDETRLQQILLNLVGNGVKFTEAGEVTISVSAQRMSQQLPRYELQFDVSDTGVGVPRDRQPHLFQSFSQGDASTTRRYGGTGLGLAISRRLAEAMEGSMWVESTGLPGAGATFAFTILAAEHQDATAPKPAAAVRPAAQERRRLAANPPEYSEMTPEWVAANPHVLKGKHVLLVLGNRGCAVQWRSLTLQSEHLGMEVRICTTLDEAAAWHSAGNPVDVAIVDHQFVAQMAAEAHVRLARALPEVPWLALTPVGRRPSVSVAPIVAYVSKPVHALQWYEALLFATGKRHTLPASMRREQLFDAKLAERFPLRILVVEDNPVNQLVIRRLLERLGYRAVTANNGRAALEAVETEAYDLVLMDMQMPEMDGLETTRWLRRWEMVQDRSQRMAIVALTANSQAEDRSACIEAGMDAFLSKPIQVMELRDILENIAEIRIGAYATTYRD